MSSSPSARQSLSRWRLLSVSATVIRVDNGLGRPTKQDSWRTPDAENCIEKSCCMICAVSLLLPTSHPLSSVITGFMAIFHLMGWTALNILHHFSGIPLLWFFHPVDFKQHEGLFSDSIENLIAFCFQTLSWASLLVFSIRILRCVLSLRQNGNVRIMMWLQACFEPYQ